MNESEATCCDASQQAEEKKVHFSQAGIIREPALNQLRDQIKKAMIPLLIKTFQLKLEMSQALSPPSRLQKNQSQQSEEEITDQLNQLDKDLNVLMLWCQSSRGQIAKALSPLEEEQKNAISQAAPEDANPAVLKSFSNAVSAQSTLFQAAALQEIRGADEEPTAKKTGWKTRLGKFLKK